MSQVDETASGVANAHRDAILRVLAKHNCFVFIRPSAYESTKMVKAGLATKSMDVHDKSSDWGPMSGMVPVDPAFNKLNTGAGAKEHPEHLAHGSHGAAYPIQLEWTDLLNRYLLNDKISRQDSPYQISVGNDSRLKISKASISSRIHAFEQFQNGGKMSTFGGKGPFDAVYRSLKNSVDFCIHQSKVYWVKWDDRKTSGTLIPLLVWGYLANGKKVPVTGDYDLWMVVPHHSSLSSLGDHFAKVVHDTTVDEKGVEVSRGASTASAFTQQLNNELNQACAEAIVGSQRVFNHGAEAQNYAFTQKIDRSVGMFTPGGTSRMVDTLTEVPEILADLQRMGYVVIFNKRYTDSDARLMGSSTIHAKTKFEQAKKTYLSEVKEGKNLSLSKEKVIAMGMESGFAIGRRSRIHASLSDTLNQLREFRGAGTELNKKERARARIRRAGLSVAMLVQATGKTTDEIFQHKEILVVQQLGNDIRAALESAAGELTRLQSTDFPQGTMALANEARVLLREYAEAATSATVNGGETDVDQVTEFLKRRGQSIESVLSRLRQGPPRN